MNTITIDTDFCHEVMKRIIVEAPARAKAYTEQRGLDFSIRFVVCQEAHLALDAFDRPQPFTGAVLLAFAVPDDPRKKTAIPRSFKLCRIATYLQRLAQLCYGYRNSSATGFLAVKTAKFATQFGCSTKRALQERRPLF